MEEVSPERSRYAVALIFGATGLLVLVIVLLLLGKQPIQTFVPASTVGPVARLAVTVVDTDDNTLSREESRLAAAAPSPTPDTAQTPIPAASDTSPATGGAASGTPTDSTHSTPTMTPTPTADISLRLVRHMPAFSAAFPEPQTFLDWLEKNSRISDFVQSKVAQGILQDFLRTARVRSEDLNLDGFRGVSVMTLAREALNADASIHYDLFEGRKGFVFTFVRDKAPIVSRVLPILIPAVARHEYALADFKGHVIEILLGEQQLFILEDEGRVYVSNGIKSLLNAVDLRLGIQPVLDTQETSSTVPISSAGLVLTVHGESFFRRLMDVMVHEPHFEAKALFALDSTAQQIKSELRFSAAKVFGNLRPRISDGTFAGIPQDVFGVLATSFQIPPDMTKEDWNNVALGNPLPKSGESSPTGGLAVIWDLNAEQEAGTLTDIGVVVSMPEAAKATMHFKDYFGEEVFMSECADGTVWLASTSDLLLTRMKEACGRQSPSILNWFDDKSIDAEKPQMFLMIQPGYGLRETYLSGVSSKGESADTSSQSEEETEGEADSDAEGENESTANQSPTTTPGDSDKPSWKKDYDSAVQATTKESEKLFSNLPAFLYLGGGDERGVRLKGYMHSAAERKVEP